MLRSEKLSALGINSLQSESSHAFLLRHVHMNHHFLLACWPLQRAQK